MSLTQLTECGTAYTAAEIGALSATYALEVVGTQNHSFSLPDFVERFRARVNDSGKLDRLLEPV